MREIKFRARWRDTGKPIPDFMNDYIINVLNDETFIVERYADFRDKAGDEIYEGDKCAVNMATGEIVNAFVVFVDGCFELHFVSPIVIDGRYNDKDYLKCWVCNYAVEIIGNIHETPELLK